MNSRVGKYLVGIDDNKGRDADVAERRPRSHPGREELASSPQFSDEPRMVLEVQLMVAIPPVDPCPASHDAILMPL